LKVAKLDADSGGIVQRLMEHAPLRPVPARPAGPVEPATAVRELSAWLPELPPPSARALALVVLAERPRAEVAGTLGVSEAELGALLASARKELRQTVVVLGGSGWCERAEGLISDRLDDALADRDARRLDVHLRNCPRCVEHERRLVQATDALIGGVGGFARGPARAPGEAPAPLAEATPEDGGVEEGDAAPAPAAPEDGAPTEVAPKETAPTEAAPRGAAPTEAAPRGAAPTEAAPTAAAPTDTAPTDAAPKEAASEHTGPKDVPSPEAALPEVAPQEAQIAAAAEVLVAKRTRAQIAAAVAWNSLIALAILLALATIALTIAGILGAEL
jgi:hypothetical protein